MYYIQWIVRKVPRRKQKGNLFLSLYQAVVYLGLPLFLRKGAACIRESGGLFSWISADCPFASFFILPWLARNCPFLKYQLNPKMAWMETNKLSKLKYHGFFLLRGVGENNRRIKQTCVEHPPRKRLIYSDTLLAYTYSWHFLMTCDSHLTFWLQEKSKHSKLFKGWNVLEGYVNTYDKWSLTIQLCCFCSEGCCHLVCPLLQGFPVLGIGPLTQPRLHGPGAAGGALGANLQFHTCKKSTYFLMNSCGTYALFQKSLIWPLEVPKAYDS